MPAACGLCGHRGFSGGGRCSLSDRCGAGGRRVKALAREVRKLAAKVGAKRTAVRDRSRAARLRALGASMRRRSGQAKEEVLELTGQTGQLLQESVKERGDRLREARRRARGRGAQAKLRTARSFEELAERLPPPAQGQRRPPDLGRMVTFTYNADPTPTSPARTTFTRGATGQEPEGTSRQDDHSTTRTSPAPFLTSQYRAPNSSGKVAWGLVPRGRAPGGVS